jgi:two-component system CheB/CheR fusion protein
MTSPWALVLLAVVGGLFIVAGVLLRRYELARAVRLRLEAEQRAQTSVLELRQLQHAIDQASIVAMTDQRGRILYVNDKFCEISKYTREELIGQDHRIINSGLHPPEFMRDLWVTIARGHVWRGEIRNRAKHGTNYWVSTTIVPLLDERGKPYRYLAIRNDITARKEAEAKLVEQASLARVGELAAVVAHEVRNPLAGLRGSLQVLQQRQGVSSGDQAVIREMIRRLDGLSERVTDLLLYAKPRKPKFEAVNLRPLAEATAESIRRQPAMAGLVVDVTGDAAARADAELLREVLLNVLLNAAQALDGRGAVRISLAQQEQAVVTICDEGPGIPAHLRESVFEPFFTTKHAGTGLGLAIVRRLVELHGGSVVAGATINGGAMITITLPAGVTQQAA